MVDRLKAGSPAWLARQKRWRHNSFFGHIALAQANMRAILASETASARAKRQAESVLYSLNALKIALTERQGERAR
jgi:hypothetical protein